MEGLLDTEESVQLVLAAWTHYYSTAQDLADNESAVFLPDDQGFDMYG